MKKTLLALAIFSTVLSVQAQSKTSVLSPDRTVLTLESGLKIKKYPGDEPVKVVRKPKENIRVHYGEDNYPSDYPTNSHNPSESLDNMTPVHNGNAQSSSHSNAVYQKSANSHVAANPAVMEGDKMPGYTSAKTTVVYQKSFLGVSYDPVEVVVEPAKPIYFGQLHFNNITCASGANNGSIDLYSNQTTSSIPLLFCPSGLQTSVNVNILTFDENTNKLVIRLGEQKITIEKGITSIYNLRYDEHNVINLQFFYNIDEHPVRY